MNGYEKEKIEKKAAMEAGIYLREGLVPMDATIERVRQLADMLASGKSDPKVRKYIASEYEVKDDRTIDRYMSAAYRLLTPADWNEEKERIIAKNIKTLQTIIDKTMDKENYRLAKEAIDSLNRMFGLTGGNNVTIARNDKGDEMINISFD